MGYLKIPNLYKTQDILMFKEVYALEKIHGSSSHISFNSKGLCFFSGGAKHEQFVELFDQEDLIEKLDSNGLTDIVVYGEVYGGKMQGMSDTYGKDMKFIAFDVVINDNWLTVPNAEEVVKLLGLEFVHYVKCPTKLEDLDRERDRDSVQAIRNGLGPGHPSEGVVLRPLMELTANNGNRVIVKHKKAEFRETSKIRKVIDPAQLEILKQAQDIADEWVTPMRLNHVVDKLGIDCDTSNLSSIIPAMIQDVKLESEGEVEWSKACEKAIGKTTATLVKRGGK